MSDYLSQHLADLPEVVDAHTLAAKCGWGVGTVYQRSNRSKKNPGLALLPQPLIIPGANQLVFARAAVIDWFQSAIVQTPPIRKRGRPRGALSRRGIGREALETRLAEEVDSRGRI